MDVGLIAAFATPALAVLLQIGRERFGTSRRRRQLLSDLNLYQQLPDGSRAKTDMLARVEKSYQEMMVDETTKRRNWSNGFLGLMIGALGLYLAYVGWGAGSWLRWAWFIGAGLTVAVGLSLSFDGFRRVERDQKGNAVRHQRFDESTGA